MSKPSADPKKPSCKKTFLALTLVCFLLGALFAVAFNNMASVPTKQEETMSKNQKLIQTIDELEAEIGTLEEDVSATREEISHIQEEQSETEGDIKDLQDTLNLLRLESGYTEVNGPGIVLTLNDNTEGAEAARNSSPETFNAENYIVHDKNLLYLSRELCKDAEAISINGQRLVDSSSIRCVGTVIMVNSTRLAPPYQMSIIGNPDLLMKALENSSEYQYLLSKGIPLSVEQTKDITIPAYTGAISAGNTSGVSDPE